MAYPLQKLRCYEVRVLANLAARDLRTTTGKNLKFVKETSGLDPLTANFTEIKKAIVENEQVEVAPVDQWRIPYLEKLLMCMQEFRYRAMDKEQEELKELVDSLVIFIDVQNSNHYN